MPVSLTKRLSRCSNGSKARLDQDRLVIKPPLLHLNNHLVSETGMDLTFPISDQKSSVKLVKSGGELARSVKRWEGAPL